MCFNAERDFMETQVRRIDVDKWEQGVNQDSDPGEKFIMNWVICNAKNFRDDWNESACRTCETRRQCGYRVLTQCEFYNEGVQEE